jgi:purine-nucleoside phosphorylase
MDRLRGRAELAVILGTGLSSLEGRYEIELGVPFEELPGLGAATAPGHPGMIALVRDRPLLLFLGRLHCYEGLSIDEAGQPARTAADLGCRRLLLTQAAGGLRRDPPVGTWILADDIVSFPQAVPGGDGGGHAGRPSRDLVSAPFRDEILGVAQERGVELRRGTLFWTTGPTYETVSEARAALELGAAAASMSALPELVAARALGIEAAVLSLITNHAPSVQADPIDHESVTRRAAGGLETLAALIDGLLGIPPRKEDLNDCRAD